MLEIETSNTQEHDGLVGSASPSRSLYVGFEFCSSWVFMFIFLLSHSCKFITYTRLSVMLMKITGRTNRLCECPLLHKRMRTKFDIVHKLPDLGFVYRLALGFILSFSGCKIFKLPLALLLATHQGKQSSGDQVTLALFIPPLCFIVTAYGESSVAHIFRGLIINWD